MTIDFNKGNGLVPVIAQEAGSGQVMMFAWMNREALAETAATGYAVYWSRSRQVLWRKGESSGHRQRVIALYLDCDADVLVMEIEQAGGIACHTGRKSCFYRRLHNGEWHREGLPPFDGTHFGSCQSTSKTLTLF